MPGSFKREDLRIVKTYKALESSLMILLEKRNFNHITVYDLCEEALVSRATFYTHFNDKYDLLRYCMTEMVRRLERLLYISWVEMETGVNAFFRNHRRIVKNVLEDANAEVLMLLHNFMEGVLEVLLVREGKEKQRDILYTFCAGGMVSLLNWQVKNKFPENAPPMSPYLYDMLKCFMFWEDDFNEMQPRTGRNQVSGERI